MRPRHSLLGLISLAAVLAPPAAAPVAAAPVAAGVRSTAVEAYLQDEMAARSIPGLAWAAVSGGEVAAEGYLGLANVELDVPVAEGSVFAIASLDKALTAAGVMVLAQRGRLSLDDLLERWVPGDWGGITLRHLLSHTSGLPDVVASDHGGRLLTDYSEEELVANVRSLPRQAPPGERYLYSDANAFLAQLATAAAAGEPWRELVGRELFAPAIPAGATFLDPGAIVRGRVGAYALDGEGALVRSRRIDVDFGPLYNDLGMTARDFASWLIALGGDRPLSRASREAMWTPAPLADGRPNDETWQWRRYGLGLGLDEWAGRRIVTHSGSSGVGFVLLPDEGRGVVVLTNLQHTSGSDPIGLAWGILGRLWPELALPTAPVADPEPDRTAALRAEYERLLGGAAGLEAWAPRSRLAGWEGAGGLAGRARRLGELRAVRLVGAERVGGETRRLLLAEHARGRVLLRFALDAEGRIVAVTWLHL